MYQSKAFATFFLYLKSNVKKMSRSSDGTKPLSGKSYASGGSQEIQDAIITSITSGAGGVFNNITITGGTIDGVTIGENLPGPGYFTQLEVGKPDGTGGPVCFLGIL